MTVETIDPLFLRELKDIYAEEKELINALDELANEKSDERLQQIFEQHKEETQEHINRLETVFDEIDESPEADGGEAIKGMVKEHRSFMETEPTEQINAAYDMGMEKKAERYEITAYETLIELANAMGLSEDAVRALQANLSDERKQLDRLQTVSYGTDLRQLRP